MAEFNFLAIFVAALSTMIVGSIWYGPLFGKDFMASKGMNTWTPEEQAKMKSKMMGMYIQQLICSFITAFVIANILWAFSIARPEQSALSAGLQGGFWIWLGFYLPVKYGEKLWSGSKGNRMFFIDAGYSLIILVLMSLILSYWR